MLFSLLLEKLSESNASKELIDQSPKLEILKNADSEKINEVFKYISNNLDNNIELKNLANLINLSPPSFCRYFKQKTQKTLSRYIAELRVENACKLLQNEDLTVEEIGYKIGYNNLVIFYASLKK